MTGKSPSATGTLPPWGQAVLADPVAVIDGSAILAAGGSPMGDAMAQVDRVEPGRGFVVRAPFDPTPLRSMLEGMGLESAAALGEDGHWRAVFRKPPAG
ncbi:MAG: DUF2249 domain-containing protein [Rhodospirillum sp.]|nr:DUF2249 domain-containing protein [Rhodospirillum sp.]MCF8488377.1 DUF2249 domain-containing protein [Rhodospirillum sp.]MCF8500613.1 DUF2249 domain-containing protein [Rhodospirillum sp.]